MNQILKAKIGVSAIAWLNDDMPELTRHISLQQALSDMQKIGFRGTENGGAFPQEASELSDILAQYDLELVSGWHSGQLGGQNLKQEIAAITPQLNLFKTLGARVIVYGETGGAFDVSKPLADKPVIDDYKAYAKKLNALACHCQDVGVPLALHHHMSTMVESMEELESILDLAPDVNIVFDTGHCLMAGGDPLKACQDYAQRINHFHLKDVRADILKGIDFSKQSFKEAFLQGVFTVPGDGCIDYEQLIPMLKHQGYEGWFVIEAEQDPHIANPFIYSQMGYQYTHQLLTRHGYHLT